MSYILNLTTEWASDCITEDNQMHAEYFYLNIIMQKCRLLNIQPNFVASNIYTN